MTERYRGGNQNRPALGVDLIVANAPLRELCLEWFSPLGFAHRTTFLSKASGRTSDSITDLTGQLALLRIEWIRKAQRARITVGITGRSPCRKVNFARRGRPCAAARSCDAAQRVPDPPQAERQGLAGWPTIETCRPVGANVEHTFRDW